ncbi:LLM class flavin-dependent oxidoreductase [Streptomyces sp. LHD-70]|uniref:LLM class flavin-dependent oxidoreductase n=1 Tax=Streptomyces sp. LHD-70 TaxID=3072140 RepID=UPI00280C7884|nr:LLM class flavin-dependent oxidoreductase [Streptomyces sp. LHD-70]MDQ8705151.1 LLM class flavin-dependent oxidoreductase [Streptomyces sp. LHD-70]
MIRIGVIILPEQDWDTDRERWERADAYGFDHAWTYDHLAWRTLADGPWHATIPTLVAAALTTSRIRLGTLVTTPNFRHPVPLAKDLMTVDVMSHGRLTIALGAGAPGFDSAVLGGEELSPAQRFDRFVEFRDVLDRLLSERVTDWSGEWYSAVDARMIPGPAQRPRPPFLIAADGPRGMRLAASTARRPGDGWVTMGTRRRGLDEDTWWAEVARTVRRMDETLDGPWPQVRMLNMESGTAHVSSVEHLRDRLGRASELGFTDVTIAWPRRDEPFRGDEATLDAIAADLSALRRVND